MQESVISSGPPPQSVCLLRTSALGDVTHVVPLVRSLQRLAPTTRLTWIVGKFERKLVGDIDGVEFVTFDKRAGFAGYRDVRRQLAGRRFDVLLHLQVALRANLLSALVNATQRIGYDAARSKDLHGLFINRRIAARNGEHVVDALGSFLEPLGLCQDAIRWDIPIPDEALQFAERCLPGAAPTLLVSPCSSHAARNWLPARYAAVIDHAHARGWRAVVSGGPARYDRDFADAILAACREAPIDLVGKDTLKQFLALARRADLVLTPDSGPMHMANAVGTKVLGLHAASNPQRSGPYSDRRWCVDRYDAAARKYRGRPASELPWGAKLEYPGVMELVEIDDVIERFDAFDKFSREPND